MTIMPVSSHISISSGAGMLCEVRMALQPISFSSWIRCRIADSFTMPPSGPRSWWRQTPRNFSGLPFSRNPSPCTASTVRMPNTVT